VLKVVGVDGSAASRDALAFAADEARSRDAVLTVATAWDEPDPIWLGSYGAPIPDTSRTGGSRHELAKAMRSGGAR